jgi:SulP family sulfate permease
MRSMAPSPTRTTVRELVPILDWLPAYDRSWLRFDLIAALTVWAIVVPQAIAYAAIAGLPPQAGLAATAAGLLAYALLGTSRQLVVSPTSSTAAISATLIATVVVGSTASFETLSAALALTLGVVFVVLAFARIGFVSRFIPMAISVGFMFGLGLTIIVGQLAKILGVPGSEGTFIDQTIHLLGQLGNIDIATLTVGSLSLAAMLVGRRWLPAVPMALIVVVGSIVAVAVFGLEARGVEVLGVIEGGFPRPALPIIPLADLFVLIPGALALAVLGYAETNQVAEAFAEEHGYEIRPDQELFAVGGANVLSGLVGGFIVAGGASQSAASDKAGARSQVMGLFVAALAILTMVALLPLFQDLPQAALAAIVISAVIGFLRVNALRRLASLRRSSIVLALIALAATVGLGILAGLMTAVILGLLYLLMVIARADVVEIGRAADGSFHARHHDPSATPLESVLILRLEAPLLFLNAKKLRDEVRAAVREAGRPIRLVVIDLGGAADLDPESRDILEGLAAQLAETGVELRLANVRAAVRAVLDRPDSTGHVVDIPTYRTLTDAVSPAPAPPGPRPA